MSFTLDNILLILLFYMYNTNAVNVGECLFLGDICKVLGET